MLIRSQDKMALANYNAGLFLEISNTFGRGYDIRMQNEAGYLELGRYTTEEKALRVLDMIQDEYANYARANAKVFEMPQDNEVD